ncbi:MAG: ADP-glyceromanno-heptose 6-epimerase [Deltaproteobacteria bacterium]|jgi:ADP-L-glycero-D-manno-heptose 6-epimerase|nr:ADP-glyceromanno-heptose 6-epimerase [Deltaproteobacteria bacterium]
MYIVTGGSGFIGSAVIWKLNSLGIDDILVVDNLGRSEKWKNLVNRSYLSYQQRDDFLDRVKAGTINEEISAIIHLGACSSTTEKDADFLMRNNLEYSKTLCSFALERGARFIVAGSAATYGNGASGFADDEDRLENLRPLSMYGYSKHLFDLWAKRNGLLKRIVCLKFFNVYGPNEYHKGEMRSVVHKAFTSIRETGGMALFRSDDPAYPDGGQRRDFIQVKDCAAMICWLLEHPEVCGIFNAGTGTARTWNDLAKAVAAAMNVPARISYKDMPDDLTGAYQNFTEASTARLRAAGYTAPLLTLEQGVRDYVAGYLMKADPYL